MEVEPPLEALDLGLVWEVLADAVPSVLSKRRDEILEFLVLSSRPNDAVRGSLVLPVALSLPRQSLAVLVDSRCILVNLNLIVMMRLACGVSCKLTNLCVSFLRH